jgi:hypothetical protein
MASPNTRSGMFEGSEVTPLTTIRLNAMGSSGRPRRGSVQLMHDINIQQFPYQHHEEIVPNSPMQASPSSLLSKLLSGSIASEQHAFENDDVNAPTPHATNCESLPLFGSPAGIAAEGTFLEANMNSERRAARELLYMSDMRRARSVVDPRGSISFGGGGGTLSPDERSNEVSERWMTVQAAAQIVAQDDEQQKFFSDDCAHDGKYYGSTEDLSVAKMIQPPGPSVLSKLDISPSGDGNIGSDGATTSYLIPEKHIVGDRRFAALIQQMSAVAVVALLNMMMAIPFGASYFPVGWKTNGVDDRDGTSQGDENDVSGAFPLPGKQALGRCYSCF